MKNDQAALKDKGEAENILGTPPVSEPELKEPEAAGEAAETEIEATAEVKEEAAETAESPKKGAQARIRELHAKAEKAEERATEAETKAQSLAEKLADLTGSVEPQVPPAPYFPQAEPGAEITSEQYKQDVLQTADALVQLRVKQSEAVNRINNEANEVLRKYPQLDPENDAFDKELSDTVSEATEAYVKANPYSASVKKFVAKLMKPYERAVAREVSQQSENIAKQVSQTAMRPTQVATTEKEDKDLTIEELEKKYGIVHS